MPAATLAGMRAIAATVLTAAVVALGAAAGEASSADTRPRVTVIGDSVAASLNHVPRARALLGRGVDLRLDAQVCRRLVGTSCPFQGSRPRNVVETIAATRRLGDVVVIDVGYNDDPAAYAAGIDQVMTILSRGGVHTVIWSTLKVDRPGYGRINAAIRKAAKRWRTLRVVDWNAHSRGHASWFVSDGLHVNVAGALGLARMLRGPVALATCGGPCTARHVQR
jgi:hypothetical protein